MTFGQNLAVSFRIHPWYSYFITHQCVLTRDIDIANLSVRYVPVSDENGLTYRRSFFTVQ